MNEKEDEECVKKGYIRIDPLYLYGISLEEQEEIKKIKPVPGQIITIYGKEEIPMELMIDDILSITNYKVKKNFEDLRKRILLISRIDEKIENKLITYYYGDKKFCSIKVKRDLLEIDFISDKTFTDPTEFSWKIRSKEFNRRMQLKNVAQIDIVLGLLEQSIER